MFFHTKYRIQNTEYRPHGFTLIELLIALGVTVTVSTIGVTYYVNQQKAKLLDTTIQEITAYLKYAQQKSISQEQGLQWGVHFENPSSGTDFYALYTGTSYTTPIETKYLPAGLEFQTPTTGNSINISFSKLTGLNAGGSEQELIVRLTSNQVARVIRVTSAGLVTLNEGEKGYWKFDEGSGTIALDSTIYKNNGTLYNGPTWQSPANCVSGSCLSFDGSDDYVEAGTNTIIGTNPFTLEAWLKTNTVSQYSGAIAIGSSAGGQSAYIGTVATAQVGTSNSIGGGFYGRNYGSGVQTIGDWVHVVMTFGGGTNGIAKIYVNGVEKITDTYTPNLQGTYTRIGRIGTDTTYNFNGLIDEVRIYNRALSPAEIQQHYNSRS